MDRLIYFKTLNKLYFYQMHIIFLKSLLKTYQPIENFLEVCDIRFVRALIFYNSSRIIS